MKNITIFIILSFSIIFASNLIIYNDAGLYSASVNVNGKFAISVPDSIIVDTFESSIPVMLNFEKSIKIDFNSILSANKYITLNNLKYNVVSVKPLILERGGSYFYNMDLKEMGFSNLPKQKNSSFTGFTKASTLLTYRYMFSKVSWNLRYFFEDGKINAAAVIHNNTDFSFDDNIYLVSEIANTNPMRENELRFSKTIASYSKSYSSQQVGERYVYNLGKVSLKPNSTIVFLLFKTSTTYITYYKYYPSPNITNLRAVIHFRAPIQLPRGVWMVLEKKDNLEFLSPAFQLNDEPQNSKVDLDYDYSYDVRGYETTYVEKDSKYVYRTFVNDFYNYKDSPVTVKIYKRAPNADTYKFNGSYDKVGDYFIFTLQIKPKSRGEFKYTLKYLR